MGGRLSDETDQNKEQKPCAVETDNNFGTRVLFFTGITLMSAIGGFGAMLSRTERQNKVKPGSTPDHAVMENGAALARKALGRATIYAVGGFSLFCYASWKVMGVKNFEELRMKLGNTFPKIHRPREPEEVDWDEILYGKGTEDAKKTKDTS